MAISRTAKVDIEISKTKAKIAEQQAKLKELEQKRLEIENTEIVEMVRGLRVPLDQLSDMLKNIKGGTSGQTVPKSAPSKNETEDTNE